MSSKLRLGKMKQKFILERKENLSRPEYISKYLKGCEQLDRDEFFDGEELKVEDEFKFSIPEGNKSQRTKTDAENAVKIHRLFTSKIPNFSELDASDERFWIFLSHTYFKEYTIERWFYKEGDISKGAIESRLFTSGRAALLRNSISRLWWSAHLTYQPWVDLQMGDLYSKTDPYYYTKKLLSNQEVFQALMEREFSRDRKLLIAFLVYLFEREHKKSLSDIVRSLTKKFLIPSRVRQMRIMKFKDILDLLNELD